MASINLSDKILKFPENDALIGAKRKISWQEFQEQVTITVRMLKILGIREHDRVAVLTGNNHDFPLLFFALLNLRAITVPLRPDLPEPLIQKNARAAGCCCLIVLEKAITISGEFPIRLISAQELEKVKGGVSKKLTRRQETAFLFSAEQPATILFTSGSGGEPAGIMHTVGNHYFSALGANRNMTLTEDDRWLIVLPFYHVSGLSILFRTIIAAAASVIGNTEQQLAVQLSSQHITHVSLVPTQLQRLLDDPAAAQGFPALRAVLTGGSQCPPALTNRALQTGMPLFLSYGSTEMASQITTAGTEELLANPLSSGKPLLFRRVEIGENSEILVGGKTLGKPLSGLKKSLADSRIQGLSPSGDTGRFDKNGSLIVIGRLDNMFISGGENVYPEEIENALLSLDAVNAACVVPVPDPAFGARPVAYVNMKSGNTIDKNSLRSGLEKILPRFKIPTRFIEWQPEAGQLKPDRKALRQKAIEFM